MENNHSEFIKRISADIEADNYIKYLLAMAWADNDTGPVPVHREVAIIMEQAL